MPKHAVQIDSDLRHEIAHPQFQAFPRITAFRQWTDEMVLIQNSDGAMEFAQFIQGCGIDGRFSRSKPNAESRGLKQFDSLHGFLPCPWSAIGIMILGSTAIRTHLHSQV